MLAKLLSAVNSSAAKAVSILILSKPVKGSNPLISVYIPVKTEIAVSLLLKTFLSARWFLGAGISTNFVQFTVLNTATTMMRHLMHLYSDCIFIYFRILSLIYYSVTLTPAVNTRRGGNALDPGFSGSNPLYFVIVSRFCP